MGQTCHVDSSWSCLAGGNCSIWQAGALLCKLSGPFRCLLGQYAGSAPCRLCTARQSYGNQGPVLCRWAFPSQCTVETVSWLNCKTMSSLRLEKPWLSSLQRELGIHGKTKCNAVWKWRSESHLLTVMRPLMQVRSHQQQVRLLLLCCPLWMCSARCSVWPTRLSRPRLTLEPWSAPEGSAGKIILHHIALCRKWDKLMCLAIRGCVWHTWLQDCNTLK